jgi:hypothetical protein
MVSLPRRSVKKKSRLLNSSGCWGTTPAHHRSSSSILQQLLLTAVAYNSWACIGRPAAVSEATVNSATGRPVVCADPAEIPPQKVDAEPGKILLNKLLTATLQQLGLRKTRSCKRSNCQFCNRPPCGVCGPYRNPAAKSRCRSR